MPIIAGMNTIIDGSKIFTAGMFVLCSPLPPWAMFAVITAGMIYNFRDKTPRLPSAGRPEQSVN